MQMDLYPKNKLPLAEVKKFILIFYTVALTGFLIPFTRDVFIRITPLAIGLSTYLLAVYHTRYSKRDIFAFLLVFLLGFLIEVIGVNTGHIFGSYHYGSALGPKILHTPLLIGINWLFLTYTSAGIAKFLKIKKGGILFVAPLIMLLYDVILEQVAPEMEMWFWQNGTVPIKNYVAWYVTGWCFVLLFRILNIETKNPLSAILLMCQLVFFLILSFFIT
ncbi:MAG TPA: carotenoid biosynthesis protein [Bacteroidetes bacterium]|nr:carotenoid biosynthesis protein [Bacteroidota bacterium]